MTRRPKDRSAVRAAAVTAAKGASWMSLVAATTLGVASVDNVRATVSSAEPLVTSDDGDGMRLIVQSYRRDSLTVDLRPRVGARPRASAQRAVTAEELARGVSVNMVDLEGDGNDRVVLAWIERGAPNLEYDALQARPGDDACIGVAAGAVSDEAHIVLRRDV
jgi:hypothetical protein